MVFTVGSIDVWGVVWRVVWDLLEWVVSSGQRFWGCVVMLIVSMIW